MTSGEAPLYNWHGHLVEAEKWEGPAEVMTTNGYQDVRRGETVAVVRMIELRRSWTVPWDEFVDHSSPVNLAALEAMGQRDGGDEA